MQIKLFDLIKKYEAHKEERMCIKYDEILGPIRHEVRSVLEIGVQTGFSLLAWKDFFPNATIVGVDIDRTLIEPEERIKIGRFSQDDKASFENLFRTHSIEKFDVIIDDAAHIGHLAKRSYEILFDNYLEEGGHYIIEDWGTAYWGHFPDGADYKEPSGADEEKGYFESHLHGMVGFLKQLVDESFRSCIYTAGDVRNSKFEYLKFQENLVTIKKPTAAKRDMENLKSTGIEHEKLVKLLAQRDNPTR